MPGFTGSKPGKGLKIGVEIDLDMFNKHAKFHLSKSYGFGVIAPQS